MGPVQPTAANLCELTCCRFRSLGAAVTKPPGRDRKELVLVALMVVFTLAQTALVIWQMFFA